MPNFPTNLPTPAVTPANWGQQLLDAIVERLTGSMAYATNESAVGTTFGTAATAIPGLTIAIPATAADVVIEWGVTLQLVTAGQGAAFTLLYETTTGTAVGLDSVWTHCRDNAYPTTTSWACHSMRSRVGPSDTSRVFAIYGQVVREAGSSLAVNARNLNGAGRSYVRAVAG